MTRWLIALALALSCAGCATVREMCAESPVQPSGYVADLIGVPQLKYWDSAGEGGWSPAWTGIKMHGRDDGVRCQFIPHCVPVRIIVTLDPNVPNARREIYTNPDGDLESFIRNRRTGAWHKVRIEMEYHGATKPWTRTYDVFMAPRSRW